MVGRFLTLFIFSFFFFSKSYAINILYKSKIAVEDNGHTTMWLVENSDNLLSNYNGNSSLYNRYYRWVRLNTNFNAVEGLSNHYALMEDYISRVEGSSNFQDFVNKLKIGQENIREIIDGRVGSIVPLSNLEAIPFIELLSFNDLTKDPIEFFVIILKKNNFLLIISDMYQYRFVGAMQSQTSKNFQKSLQNLGWSNYKLFHNHPFDFKNRTGDIGGNLSPSVPDIKLFEDTDYQFYSITNGIETISFTDNDVLSLKTAD